MQRTLVALWAALLWRPVFALPFALVASAILLLQLRVGGIQTVTGALFAGTVTAVLPVLVEGRFALLLPDHEQLWVVTRTLEKQVLVDSDVLGDGLGPFEAAACWARPTSTTPIRRTGWRRCRRFEAPGRGHRPCAACA